MARSSLVKAQSRASELAAVATPRSAARQKEGDIHFDIILYGMERKGECVYRLRERSDFPGFYEGLINFREVDVTTSVRLQFRTPREHAAAYAPRALGTWRVCRNEHLPINF